MSLVQSRPHRLPQEIWDIVSGYLSPFGLLESSSVLRYRLTRNQNNHCRIWSCIFKDEKWLTKAKTYFELDPVLIGPHLHRYYYPRGTSKPTYMVLALRDKRGELHAMKRTYEEALVTTKPVVDWTKQDRQPDWGDVVILSSQRRQQRLVTPEQDCDGSSSPGATVKKKRRVLSWNEEGRAKWPGEKQALAKLDEAGEVELVKDSDDGSESGGESGELNTSDTSDDFSSFVVEDDSKSVVEEESVSERHLARKGLEEVRLRIVERMEKLKRRLEEVDAELEVLTQVDSDTEEGG